jgi:non-lysosomal glucosylceramidase
MGRLFPELDRLLRERADFDPAVSFKPDGMIDHRGEFQAGQAVDGQAGTILRAYRDHQVSPDNAFLKRNYASVKKAMQWLIGQDGNADGILEGAQHNTLDAAWYGPVAWLSGLYLASLRATGEMATEMGDNSFAAECRAIAEAGRKNMVTRLFNGEYFINLPDAKHLDKINSGSGCEIDQVFGQGWAFQVGLGRVLPEKETRAALQSLWRYNFSPDVGPYREVNKPGRWYAMAGEAGLLMCTFPKADWNYERAKGKGPEGIAGYFNECMNGFEHQVAGHMIWEGMVTEGLEVERALHDRYHALHRNPWNEVECGDHYARSMASYGVFIAACGFEYHGPKGRIGFSPRLMPENFKAPFTAAEGWGTFSQERSSNAQTNRIEVKWGGLRLKTLAFELPPGVTLKAATVSVGPKQIRARATQNGQRVELTLVEEMTLQTTETINSKLEFV